MDHLRKVMIVGATICVLALGVFALVKSPVPQDGDVIIIKGGSLEVTCGRNHGNDCLGVNDNQGRYRHRNSNSHIMQVVVRPLNSNTALFTRAFDATHQPQIEITYR